MPLETEREREAPLCHPSVSLPFKNLQRLLPSQQDRRGSARREKAKETTAHTAQASMDEQGSLIGAAEMPLFRGTMEALCAVIVRCSGQCGEP